MRKHAAYNGTYWVFLLLLLGLFFFASSAEDVFRCPEQFGYYPDMDDCTKYYICVFGDSHHEKCTGGLFFSVELQTCDWPRNVECANGMKPGEIVVVPEEHPPDDEVFSSSRRTSATANSDPPKVQKPVTPNPESVSNHPAYEDPETRKTNVRNPAPRPQSRPPSSRTTTSVKTPSPTFPPQTTPATESSAHQTRLTTLQDENGPIPSTVSEDPLYASDDQSKVSSPLDNYDDPQQPEYLEAVPPIVISDSKNGEGVEIILADDGHGRVSIPNFQSLPNLNDYSDLKQNYNSGNPAEGASDEDHGYKKDLRNKNTLSSSQSTKPRRLESGSNNGHPKDPDVVIVYSSDNKGVNDFNVPNRYPGFSTSSPIFDEIAGHRDYGGFDIITPARNNQRGKDTNLGDRNLQSPVGSNNGHSKDPDVKLDSRNLDRTRPVENRGHGNVKDEKSFYPSLDQEDYHRLHQNGEVVQSVSFNSDQTADNRPQLKQSSKPDASAYPNSDKQRNTEFSSAENPSRLNEKDIRINPNANVDFDTIITTNNGNNKDEDAHYVPQNKPTRIFDKEYSIPESINPRAKETKLEIPPRDVPKSPSGQREQPNQSDRDSNLQRDSKPSSGQNSRQQDTTHTLPAINSPTKDVDSSYIDIPSSDNFGAYTGGQRQNRNQDNERDNVQKQGISGQQKPEETIPLQQPKQGQHPAPKDYSHVVLDTGDREETIDQAFDDQYRDYPRGYSEYDSRPHLTEDYYTNEDPETTTRATITTTAKVIRTRPTRPRRTTTPAPTTTSTTLAPIRIRTRRPLTQATRTPNKPAFVATTPASPPYRPEPLFPTPTPLSSAQKCDPRKCKVPDCRCGGTDIPGEFSPEEIPQIVLLTFDDAVNDLNHDLYNELFNTGRANPNGCPILGTFYVSHEWTDYGQVQTLYSNGHEIASHSITHSYGEKFSKNQWFREIHGQREILHLYGGVKMEDIRGMRAPFLQIGGNKMFEMLFDANFTYDSSMPVYENNPPFWPYTLDYALSHECMIFPCPTKSFPGLWEVGMIMWLDLRGGRCSMGDACSNPPDEESVTTMLMKNFDRHYKSNRAPFGLFYHSAWFNTQHHRRGFMKFLDQILKKDDVWLVTNWQAIQWIRNPTSSTKMKDFEPFDCRKLDRPTPCQNPTVCNVWYQGGVRYMKTCQPCPAKYPWVGNTGYDSRG